jgi:hypothetical protein
MSIRAHSLKSDQDDQYYLDPLGKLEEPHPGVNRGPKREQVDDQRANSGARSGGVGIQILRRVSPWASQALNASAKITCPHRLGTPGTAIWSHAVSGPTNSETITPTSGSINIAMTNPLPTANNPA